MFEEQATAINDYANADIRIGKVQVSSAVAVDFDSGANDELDGKLSQLSKFAEPKYLHQTSVATSEEVEFYEDLDLAIKANETHLHGQWRVHFHVPIFSESLGLIDTTQTDIKQCVDAIQATGNPLPHFEIETYAWNVLPKGLEEISLADGIAKEIAWFDELVK
jgi:hypothetical protein